MDPHRKMHSLPTNQSPTPPTSSSNTSFPILAISVIGILTTAILLLSYYVFVIKCCRNSSRTDAVSRLQRRQEPLALYSTAVAESHGLGEPAIRAIPTFRYGRDGGSDAMKRSFHECAVCLNEFQEGERLRLLPSCLHVFHIDCIDTWLQTNANCPVCRADIRVGTTPLPLLAAHTNHQTIQLISGGSVVIQVGEETISHEQQQHQTPRSSETGCCGPSPRKAAAEQQQKLCESKKVLMRRIHKEAFSSMGDECIDVRRIHKDDDDDDDDHFSTHPIRRSFSMDSSSDRQLYIAVQEILHQNPHFQEGGEASSSAGRIRRSFFSFGHGRSSRKAVLPIQIDP